MTAESNTGELPHEPMQQLRFADEHIDARWAQDVRGLRIPKGESAIIVNIGTKPVLLNGPRGGAGPKQSWVQPWRSLVIEDTTIISAEALVILRVANKRDLAGFLSQVWCQLLKEREQDRKTWEPFEDRWHHTSELFPGYPTTTPLWRSPQDSLNIVRIDPVAFATQGASTGTARNFQVKVNLWYATEETDCRIHNQHTFLEIHTQVYGIGRMQKFHTDQEVTQYEDVTLPPGNSHDPFMEIAADGTFIYPWHRYFADTDCIWMAIELHPIS